MRKLFLVSIIRNCRRVKFSFGICFILYVIFLTSGYLRGELFHHHDSSIPVNDGLDLDNVELVDRRHNRNLQHLYHQEYYNRHLKASSKTQASKTATMFNNKSRILIDEIPDMGNKVKTRGNISRDIYHKRLNRNEKKNKNLFSKRLPTAIIIGVKKGGTRALLEFLRAHPDVRATGPEPHFFDKNYEKGLEWYRNLMPESEPYQLTIEKTPGYFITKDAPERIYNMSTSVKLIVVVRNPVTRAISDFAQIASKSQKVQSFETTILKDNETTVDSSRTIVKIGLYSKHLEKWFSYFSRKQFHFVNGEKLVTDPGTEMLKIQKFLDLPVSITDKHFYFNKSRGFPCIRKKLGKTPHCLDESKGRKHPYIHPKAIKLLQDYYRPYNQRFIKMAGLDFGWS